MVENYNSVKSYTYHITSSEPNNYFILRITFLFI